MTEIRVEKDALLLDPVLGLPLLIQAISLLLKEDEIEYLAQIGADNFDPAVARYLSRISRILDTAAKAVETEAGIYLNTRN